MKITRPTNVIQKWMAGSHPRAAPGQRDVRAHAVIGIEVDQAGLHRMQLCVLVLAEQPGVLCLQLRVCGVGVGVGLQLGVGVGVSLGVGVGVGVSYVVASGVQVGADVAHDVSVGVEGPFVRLMNPGQLLTPNGLVKLP